VNVGAAMGQISFLKEKHNKIVDYQRRKTVEDNGENQLVPINLSGVVIPWERRLDDGADSDYKLVCTSGLEYYFVSSENWSSVLSLYSWEEVRVIGLLNTSDLTLIPQMVFPKGPTGEREKVIDLAKWRRRLNFSAITKKLNDIVLKPSNTTALPAYMKGG
jgi:hypothetical protein